jgi:GNAT superfamily N-acetyltransferase
MWWRQSSSEWQKRKGSDRKEALKKIVLRGRVPGILAYSDGEPIGWCSIAPREEFHRLERSRTLKRVDSQPVWSVVCFYVVKQFRGKGVSTRLLEEAVKYAGKQGAKIIEGYPSRSTGRIYDAIAYTGLASAFSKAGFADLGSLSKTKTIMRYELKVGPRRGLGRALQQDLSSVLQARAQSSSSGKMKVKIREYRESDRAALVKLLEELMDYIVSVDDLKRTRRMPEFGESYTRRTLQKVAEENGIIYVAEHDAEVIGVVIGTIREQTKEDQLEHVPAKFGEVLEIVVKPEYRGKGVGTMLMNKLLEYFKENNCTISGVGVLVPNRKAHRLYHELGYEDRDIYMTKAL